MVAAGAGSVWLGRTKQGVNSRSRGVLGSKPGSSPECRVEREGSRGRMKIDFKGVAAAELVALSRALWDGEAQ